MERPSSSDIRQWAPRQDWAKLGYPPPESGDDPLDLETEVAIDYVEQVTGRPQDATMPAALERLAQKADVLRVLQQIAADDPGNMETLVASAGGLRSFSTTGYSESYFDPGTALKVEREASMVNAWPELDRLLWLLMTPEKLAYWRGFLLQGAGVPAYGFVEMDWSGSNRWGEVSDIMGGGLPGDVPGFSAELGWPAAGGWPTGSYTGVIVP